MYPSSSLFNGRPGLLLLLLLLLPTGRQSRSCFGYLVSSIILV
jgi:hypothetical protein